MLTRISHGLSPTPASSLDTVPDAKRRAIAQKSVKLLIGRITSLSVSLTCLEMGTNLEVREGQGEVRHLSVEKCISVTPYLVDIPVRKIKLLETSCNSNFSTTQLLEIIELLGVLSIVFYTLHSFLFFPVLYTAFPNFTIFVT